MRKILVTVFSLQFVLLLGSCRKPPKEEIRYDPMWIPYHLERTCIDMLDSTNIVISNECRALMEITSDTIIQFNDVAGARWFKIVNFNDSLFIPLQYFTKYGEEQGSFQGKGKMTKDSLFIHYEYISNSDGSWNCDCKGGH